MKGVAIDRAVLLYELDRRCSFVDCNARMKIGITKSEALNYHGFECDDCNRWTTDTLVEKDIPEWWAEVKQDQGSALSDSDLSLE